MSENERLAVAESKIDTLEANHAEMLKCLHEIKDEMIRYKGFIGGVAFLVSCIGVLAGIFREWVTKHI